MDEITPATTATPATTISPEYTILPGTTTSPDITYKLRYYTTSQLIATTEAAVSISLSITASGTNTAGQTYRLVCSATVTGSTDQPTFTWLDPMNNPVPSGMVTTLMDSMSTLTFSSLTVSNAGTYTCRVTAGGVTETQTTTVVLNGIIILLVMS